MINGVDENKNQVVHVMYIKDIQNFTKMHICPKCGYIPPATQRGHYDKDTFEEHVNNCTSKITRSLCLNDQSTPFIPHIQKNPVYAFLLAYDRKDEYKTVHKYTTYDF
jgi:hypothetical protein